MTDTGTQSEAPALRRAGATRPARRLKLVRLRDLALIPAIIALLVYGYVSNPDVFLTKSYFVDSVLKNMAPLALVVTVPPERVTFAPPLASTAAFRP